MLRRLLALLPFFEAECAALFWLAFLAILELLNGSDGFVSLTLLGIWAVLRLAVAWRKLWIWRLIRVTWPSEIVRTPGFMFRVPSDYYSDAQFRALVRLCERERDALSAQFGFRLRRPITVVVLANPDVMSQVMGHPLSGLAAIWANAIIIHGATNLQELIRHELAHLFTARYGRSAFRPSLKSEGLAVWSEVTRNGQPIDVAVLPHLRHRGLRLPSLLSESFFHDASRQYACYLLAGSFTGFLIRRYGWDGYRKFYLRANRWNFLRVFRRHFGMTLQEAEWHWRNELTVPEALRHRARRMV